MITELQTSWLGIPLRNPLVASASPLTRKAEGAKRLEDGGVGAIVLHSLFEEQIIHEQRELDHFLNRAVSAHPEATGYLPDLGTYAIGPEEYLRLVEAVRTSVKIPVVASLNGITKGGWTEWARRIQEAGAHALELNTYQVVAEPGHSGADVEDELVALVAQVAGSLAIPVTVKLSPFYSSLPHLVARLGQAGARGVTLFNRFLQPDLDPDTLSVLSQASLSESRDLRLPLRWAAILSGRVPVQIALSGGVHGGMDVVKALMAGAQVVQVASEFIANGPDRAQSMLDEAQGWMTAKEYDSVDQIRGSMSQAKVKEPGQYERAHYMKALASLDDRFL
jgi:dihydroorotate dehydrogenase (fumarate)